jgi:hypothetical protein
LYDDQKINEKFPIEDYESIKLKKDLDIGVSIYSAVYFSFMKSNKKTYKMTASNQFDLFWKGLFCLFIQSFFTYAVYSYGKIKLTLNNETYMQLSLIFTTLLLHIGVVS